MRRRDFITLIGSALPVSAMIAALPSTSALAAVTGAASNGAGRTVKFHDGTVVPALFQCSWHLGQGRHPEAFEPLVDAVSAVHESAYDTVDGSSTGTSSSHLG